MNRLIEVYQKYSTFQPQNLDKKGRHIIAKQIARVLAIHLKTKNPRRLSVLDVGCSGGIISVSLARFFGSVTGIDIDRHALSLAKKARTKNTVTFRSMDATRTSFPDNSFDVVIANQVYSCIEKPERLFDEIYRVLTPGSICYLGASNKYRLWENQYHVPFLTMLPHPLDDVLLWITGKRKLFIYADVSHKQLSRLCHRFNIVRYTPRIVHNPRLFGWKKLYKFQSIFERIPLFFWEVIEPILPSFIWVLEKPR